MDNFLRYFYQDIGRVFRAFMDMLSAAFNFLNYLLNFPMRMEILGSYEAEFTKKDWAMLAVTYLAMILLIILICWLLLKLIRKMFHFIFFT